MVQAKSNGNLMWPRGDTYSIRVTSDGLEMTDTDYAMFAICDATTYEDVYSQFAKFKSNEAMLNIPSSATSSLEAGDYFYDVRILRGVEISGDNVIIDSADEVWSMFSPKMPALTLAEVARNV